MRPKIFFGDNPDKVEKKATKWIKENEDNFEIIDIRMHTTIDFLTLMVLYKPHEKNKT